MLFPDSAKKAISNAFYDKKFGVFAFDIQLGIEGDAVKTFRKIGEYFGNVRFANLAKLREELGLTDEISIAISCDDSAKVEAGNFVEFSGKKYLAFEVLPRDSHILILGRNDG